MILRVVMVIVASRYPRGDYSNLMDLDKVNSLYVRKKHLSESYNISKLGRAGNRLLET